jgi:predicted MFS family arabinose efflux permease
VRAYRALLTTREARWPLVTSAIHRLTPGMIILAIVLLLIDHGYSYTVAGIVTAAHQVGVALASPLQGKLADRFGPPRVLVPDGVLYLLGTIAFVVAAAREPATWVLLAIAVAAGVAFPPTTACSRVVLSRLFPSGQLRMAAFAVSTITVEVGFVVGPVTAVALASGIGAGWAVIAAGVAAAIGAVGFSMTEAAGTVPRRDRASDVLGALRAPGIRVLVVAIGTVAVAFGVYDIVVPAYADLIGEPRAAALIAAIAAGSALGGLIYGGRSWPGTLVQQLCVLAAVFAAGLFLLPLTLGSLIGFGIGLFLSGLFLGPTLICAFQLIDDLALRGTQTEAQQWTQATVLLGVATGASLAGVATDLRGPAAGFLGGAMFVGLGAVIIVLRRGRLRPADGEAVAVTDPTRLPHPVGADHPADDQQVAPPVHRIPYTPAPFEASSSDLYPAEGHGVRGEPLS